MRSLPNPITQMLAEWNQGNKESLADLMPVVYSELRRLAGRYLRQERPDHTLQATALVHEAYMELINQRKVHWQNRAHFFGLAATLMRRILVEHGRKRQAAKRDAGKLTLPVHDGVRMASEPDVDLMALDEALTRLHAIDPQKSRVVELRFFAGLTVEETSEVLGVSPITVHRAWRMAKAWLQRELDKGSLP